MKRTPPVWTGAGTRAILAPDPELGLHRVEVVVIQDPGDPFAGLDPLPPGYPMPMLECGRLTLTARGWHVDGGPGYPFKRKAEAVDFLAWKGRERRLLELRKQLAVNIPQ